MEFERVPDCLPITYTGPAAHPEAAGLPTVRQTITVEREAVTP